MEEGQQCLDLSCGGGIKRFFIPPGGGGGKKIDSISALLKKNSTIF